MSEKTKQKRHKVEEEQDPIHKELFKIHDKKSQAGNLLYLVEYQGHHNQSQWQWKPEKQLLSSPLFKKESALFNILSAQLKKEDTSYKQKLEPISIQKNVQKVQPKKIQIDRNALKEKLKNQISQQLSMDKFITKIPIKTNTTKRDPIIIHKDNLNTTSKDNLNTTSKDNSSTTSKEIPKLTPKLQNSQESVGNIPSLPKCQTRLSNSEAQRAKDQLQKSINNTWLDKIRGIRTIKGYELRNNQMMYEVQAWDRNGQTLFVPPLSSETVRKLDKVKLAIFLEECLLRDSMGDGEALQTKKK